MILKQNKLSLLLLLLIGIYLPFAFSIDENNQESKKNCYSYNFEKKLLT